jgi:hypothetical protein
MGFSCNVDPESNPVTRATDKFPIDNLQATRRAGVSPITLIKVTIDCGYRRAIRGVEQADLLAQGVQSQRRFTGVH